MSQPVSTSASFRAALSTWRVGAVALLSLSSGLPLGFVLRALPQWMTKVGVDIKTIGLITLVQAPYAFKFVWAPLMDRYAPPFLGRKRGWILVTQVALALAFGVLAYVAQNPTVSVIAAVSLAIAFASASHDIAIDGYAVDVLEPTEQAAASGARTFFYRIAVIISGNLVMWLGPTYGWHTMLAGVALLFVALMPVTIRSEEAAKPPAPVKTLREALWEPLVGFVSRPRALEIAAFLFLYRMSDNLAEALVSPFLTKVGYSDWDISVGRAICIFFAFSAGTFVGGFFTVRWGTTRSLWIFGAGQAISNIGYAVLAVAPVARLSFYAATTLESFTGGLGTAAFGILTMRLTEKRFSATQFALLTSVIALGRVLSGAPAGAIADSLGWATFFGLSVFAAVPGLIMLSRFAPWSSKEPNIATDERTQPRAPFARTQLIGGGLFASIFGFGLAALTASTLNAIKPWRETHHFDFSAALQGVLTPQTAAASVDLVSCLIFAGMAGLVVAAGMAARGRHVSSQSSSTTAR